VSGPGHDRTARQVPFLPRTRCGPTGPNYSAIDAPQIPVQEVASVWVIRELMPSHIDTPVSWTVFLCATDECISIMVYPPIDSTALDV
jgi:hypothetical protein